MNRVGVVIMGVIMGASVLILGGCAGSNRADSAPPVLVELFTSDGCEGGPAAEQMLAQLHASDPAIIPLEMHVSSFDNEKWRDPLGSIQYNDRQRLYARMKDWKVFTPQLIIDGSDEIGAGDEAQARDAVRIAAKRPKGKLLLFADIENGVLQLKVQAKDLVKITKGRSVDLMLAITEDGLFSNPTAGPNAGTRVSHSSVVREMRPLGGGTPRKPITTTYETSLPLRGGWKVANLRVVVWVIDNQTAEVIAIAAVKP